MKDIILGFLSPTGDFIRSDEGIHGETARDLLLFLGEPESKINNLYFYPTEYLIYYYNYILTHMPEFNSNFLWWGQDHIIYVSML